MFIIIIIIIIIYFEGCRPIMSFFKHSPQVFLPLPLYFTSTKSTLLQADWHRILSFLRSRCPNHQNPAHHTTSAPLQILKKGLYKSSLRFLSFNDTPHIHLIVVCSALSRLCKFSAFIAHVPYVNTLWTQAIVQRFIRYDMVTVSPITDATLKRTCRVRERHWLEKM